LPMYRGAGWQLEHWANGKLSGFHGGISPMKACGKQFFAPE
jgi:hypothetical protein